MMLGVVVGACGPRAARETATQPMTAPDPAVSLMSLQVYSPDFNQILARFSSGRYRGMRDAERVSGSMILHVSSETYPIISADRVVIETFRDNLGADLSPGATLDASRIFFPVDTNVTQDHKHGFIRVSFPTPVTPGATSITLQGNLLIRCGAGEKTLEFKHLPFQKGASFTVNGQIFTLDNIWQYDTQKNETNFSFASDGPFETIRAIRFVSNDGKQEIGKIWRIDRNVRSPLELLCSTTEKPTSMTVQVDTFGGTQSRSVPFDIETCVGALGVTTPQSGTTRNPPASTARPAETSPVCTFRVIALDLEQPITETDAKAWWGARESFSIYRKGGTTMTVLLRSAAGRLARIVPNPLSITTFTDDRGGELLTKATMAAAGDDREQSPLSSDGQEAMIYIRTEDIPKAGAKVIHFKGTVTVMLAGADQRWEAKNVALAPGKFILGPKTFKVEAVSTTLPGKSMHLGMTTDNLEGIRTLEFLDDRGKLLSSINAADQAWNRSAGMGSYLNIELPRLVDTATVRMSGFEEGAKVIVPVNLEVPIGL